jgi:23S rRNA (cytidine1920-2'-O)/16S rRNA (cytidine1409-2'-O)-methyltransferase
VVRDPAVHQQVIARVVAGYEAAGFRCAGWIESPIKGATSGNTEFLAYLQRRAPAEQPAQQARGAQPQAAARQDAPSGP